MHYRAPSAVVAGKVAIGEESSLWHHAVLRGDDNAITLGAQSNVQDNCVVHVDGDAPTRIGDRVTIGHGAIVHGCVVEDEVIVGMGAIVASRAVVGARSLLGAGTVVPEGKEIPPRSLVLGVPGRVVREVGEAELARIDRSWRTYVELARTGLHPVSDG